MTKKTSQKIEQPKLTFKQNVRGYWPLMVGALVYCIVVTVALVPFIAAQFDDGFWLVFTGEPTWIGAEAVTFENVALAPGYDTSRNAELLEDWKTEDGYVFDLGWYNSHVFAGRCYQVAMWYDGDWEMGQVIPCDNNP